MTRTHDIERRKEVLVWCVAGLLAQLAEQLFNGKREGKKEKNEERKNE
jgi:hypothetical protein